jgi:hypothetical protein
MFRRSFLLSVTFCLLFNLHSEAATPEIIPAGTILQCTLDEPNFSSKTAMVGDPVLCYLSSLSSFGHPLFPRGAVLSGHLENYRNPGHFVGKGWIQLEFDRLILPGAEVLPLSAKIISAPHFRVDKQGDVHGKGHPTRDAIEWMVPVLWPIKIITLPARGPYPAFKGETRIALRLMEDVELPSPVGRNAVPMPPWASPSSYHSYGGNGSLQALPALAQPSGVQAASYLTRAEDSSPSQLTTVIAMKGGSAFLATQYWVEGGEIHCVSMSGENKLFPLERVDLMETERVNQERKVGFVLQSRNIAAQ